MAALCHVSKSASTRSRSPHRVRFAARTSSRSPSPPSSSSGPGRRAPSRSLQNARLYDITIREDGAVKARPRILTAPGQAASLTITEDDGSRTTINIDESGNIIVEGADESDVEIEVTDFPAPPQRIYHVTILAQGQVIASPSVIVLAGEAAEVEISDGDGSDLHILIDEEGEVHVTGRDDVTVEVRVEEIEGA